MKIGNNSPKRAGQGDSVTKAAKELYLVDSAGRARIEFHGPTMEPFLQDGDQLTLRPVAWGEIRVGDIITYRFEDKMPTCRIARKSARGILLKADNWPLYRAEVGPEDVLGVVTQRRRGTQLLSNDDWQWRFYSALIIWKWQVQRLKQRLRQLAGQ